MLVCLWRDKVSWLAIIDILKFHAQGYRELFQIFNDKQ